MNDTPPGTQASSAIVRLFGALLITIGVLITTLCGLCSLAFAGGMLTSLFTTLRQPGGVEIAMTQAPPVFALLMGFGGVPIAIGVALIFVGHKMWASDEAEKRRREPPLSL